MAFTDVEIIGILKSFVNQTLVGMGALKGAPCQILSIVDGTDDHTITFKWVDNEGDSHTSTLTIKDGRNGTNGTNGRDGTDGVSPTIAVKTSTADEYILTVTDAQGSFDTPNLKGGDHTQVEVLPTASAEELGNIYQYVGTTTASYTNGYFYICVSDGETPPTYSWVQKNVQAGGGGGSEPFTGTLTQWNALSPAQKAQYEFVNIMDDEEDLNLGRFVQKYQTMPTAGDHQNEIVIYTGETTASYTNGYFYKSVSDGQSPATYSWVQLDVQPATAQHTSYNNSTSGLSATNTQGAIDEIKAGLGTAAAKGYTTAVAPNNHDLVESNSVYSAINNALTSIYTPRGEISCAELTSALLIAANVGNVYNTSDSGTTTADFMQGAGKTINVGDSVGIIQTAPNTILFNLMGNTIDLHEYQKKDLASAVEGATTVEGALGALSTNKADKVSSATAGDIAALDANGNLVDSGIRANTVITQTIYVDSGSDCDDLTDKYTQYAVGSGVANRPTTGSEGYILINMRASSTTSSVSQIAFRIGGTEIYRRNKGNAWSSWEKLATESDLATTQITGIVKAEGNFTINAYKSGKVVTVVFNANRSGTWTLNQQLATSGLPIPAGSGYQGVIMTTNGDAVGLSVTGEGALIVGYPSTREGWLFGSITYVCQ